MESEPQKTITLEFLRADGKRETTRLFHYSLIQARNAADAVFRRANGRYIEVEICTDNGYREIVSNLYATVEDLQRI